MSKMSAIVDILNTAGIPAYLPGRAPAECRTAHAVVTDGGRNREGRTTGRRMFYVSVYVPEQRPGDLSETVGRVKEALTPLRDIRASGEESGNFFDEDKKAYGMTVELYMLCAM